MNQLLPLAEEYIFLRLLAYFEKTFNNLIEILFYQP